MMKRCISDCVVRMVVRAFDYRAEGVRLYVCICPNIITMCMVLLADSTNKLNLFSLLLTCLCNKYHIYIMNKAQCSCYFYTLRYLKSIKKENN